MRNITRSMRYLPAALAACCLLATAACSKSPSDPDRPRDETPTGQKPGGGAFLEAPAPAAYV